MIIKRIIARNYRTLENVQIDLSGYYTALVERTMLENPI